MNRWLKMITTAVASINPVAGLVISGINAIVEKKEDGISNDSVFEVIKAMAKSKWNSLNSDKLSRIMDIINEKDIDKSKIYQSKALPSIKVKINSIEPRTKDRAIYNIRFPKGITVITEEYFNEMYEEDDNEKDIVDEIYDDLEFKYGASR